MPENAKGEHRASWADTLITVIVLVLVFTFSVLGLHFLTKVLMGLPIP